MRCASHSASSSSIGARILSAGQHSPTRLGLRLEKSAVAMATFNASRKEPCPEERDRFCSFLAHGSACHSPLLLSHPMRFPGFSRMALSSHVYTIHLRRS